MRATWLRQYIPWLVIWCNKGEEVCTNKVNNSQLNAVKCWHLILNCKYILLVVVFYFYISVSRSFFQHRERPSVSPMRVHWRNLLALCQGGGHIPDKHGQKNYKVSFVACFEHFTSGIVLWPRFPYNAAAPILLHLPSQVVFVTFTLADPADWFPNKRAREFLLSPLPEPSSYRLTAPMDSKLKSVSCPHFGGANSHVCDLSSWCQRWQALSSTLGLAAVCGLVLITLSWGGDRSL